MTQAAASLEDQAAHLNRSAAVFKLAWGTDEQVNRLILIHMKDAAYVIRRAVLYARKADILRFF